MTKIKNNLRHNFYLKAFLLGFLTAFCLFIPFLVVDKGFFTYAGDFNSQQIPFYMYMVRMVQSGNLKWGWAIDLGSSVITSYSFYLLGSPFFWLACLFPYKAIPYLMPFLLMLKFAVGCLGAFGYLRRYAKDDNYALIGALLYTFSGFAIYNIFFNHFIESVVFFPYMIWAMDEFVYNDKKGIFPLAVALNLINNYFFFVGQAVFLIIYFFVKVYTGEYRIPFKKFFNLFFEAVLGCVMGMVLLIPSAVSLVQNPRVLNSLQNFGIWMYSTVQQYFAILASAFLPPDPPYIPSLFTSGNIKWTSLSAFVAFGGMFGFFVFKKYNKHSAFFITFSACIICAFIPVFNSMFYAFNSSYYARWFYMPILMLRAMNMQSYAMDKKQIYHGLKITRIITAIFAIFGLTPTDHDGKLFIGIESEVAIYWMNMLIALLSLYLVYVTVSNYKDKINYTSKLQSGALVVIMLFGILHMGVTKMPQYEADQLYKPQNYDILEDFGFDDETKNYRMDAYNCYDNMSLFTGVPCIRFFNSTVTPSIMEFYPSVGVKRDVSSKPDPSIYALRGLLSVKYLMMPNWEVENYKEEGNLDQYKLIKDDYPYNIYENEYFVPMGFCYDKFVTYDSLSAINASRRSNILMRALAFEDLSLTEKYDLQLEMLSDDDLYDFSYERYIKDCIDRGNMASYYFNQTDDGFDCKIKMDKANLVFFSVPYDKGFTAYVNGVETEIEKVSYGMCAVYAPAGDNEITFIYKTPYLGLSAALSAIGVAIWAGYVVWLKIKKNKI